jgi:hypothetical protein
VAWLCLKFQVNLAESGLARCGGFVCEAALLGLLLRLLFRSAVARTQEPQAESCRWLILAVASVLLTLPYARPERVGAGDAQDYAEHLADFITQARQGVFPVLVGQSRFAFNGAFNPLRTAPYFQYVGGALSALSFGTLGPFALQNLEIVLSLLAAAFSAYLCLLRLAPRRGWFCLPLALLYVSSPGVLALAYSGDMFPSWLTLPYLPLYAYLLVRLVDEGANYRRLNALAIVMAAIWTAHAPIAMWLTFIAVPIVGWILISATAVSWRHGLLLAGCGLAIFIALAGYEFVSVLELRLPGIPPHFATYTYSSVSVVLAEGWKGFLRPVSANASSLLTDLQLSPGLWLCIIAGLLGWRKGGWGLRVLLLGMACLLTLLLPLPIVAGRVWHALPPWVGRITDQWPMQRFFPILSALAPFAALLAFERARLRRRWITATAVGLLAAGCLWSGLEARKFIWRGYRVAAAPALSRRLIDGQSTVLSVYSYAMLAGLPRYYSHGPVTPDLQLHLLDRDSLAFRGSNQQALLSGAVPSAKTWTTAFRSVAGGAILQPALRLEAGRSYLFHFDFKGIPPPGTLVVTGRDFLREYQLPASGGELAFGAGGSHLPEIGLHIGEHAGGDIVAMHYFSASGQPSQRDFADLKVISYRADDLPFRVISLVPFRVAVKAARGGWMETPRIFIPGYSATVDGKMAAPQRSPDGLVMLRVPAGRSELELRYVGPPLLRAAFWVTLGGWLILLPAWLGRHALDRVLSPSRQRGSRERLPQAAAQRTRRLGLATALVGFYAAIAFLAYGNFRRTQERDVSRHQRAFTIHFPAGRSGQTVNLQTVETPGISGTLLATYLDGDHVRLQFAPANGLRSSTGPVFVNFLAEQEIECGQLPGGVHTLLFNNQLIWRSDEREALLPSALL